MQRISVAKTICLVGLIAMAACDSGQPTGLVVGNPGGTSQTPTPPRADAKIVSATGDISGAVDSFRTLLGTLNPNVTGEQPGGRREINWDGIPAALTNNDDFPGDFFNTNSPRGLLMSTDGAGFRVSNNGFTDVNSAYLGEFNTFSPAKLFAPRGSTTIDISFVVAGTNTPALVNGFGSVFADVDRAQSSVIEFFGADGASLLKVAAPIRSDRSGLSFVGAKFDSLIVARVRITVGDIPLGPDALDNAKQAGPHSDLVAVDDFIYGEPRVSHH